MLNLRSRDRAVRVVDEREQARTRRKGGFVCNAVAGNPMMGKPVIAHHSLHWPEMHTITHMDEKV